MPRHVDELLALLGATSLSIHSCCLWYCHRRHCARGGAGRSQTGDETCPRAGDDRAQGDYACPSGGADDNNRVNEDFVAQNGGRINVTTDISPNQGEMQTNLKIAAAAGSIPYDLLWINAHGITSFAAGGLLTELDPYIARDGIDMQDLFRTLRAQHLHGVRQVLGHAEEPSDRRHVLQR